MKHTLPLLAVIVMMTASASAQGPNVRPWLQQIASGWTTEAKKALPDLLIDHPNDPGVMFLHASLVDEPQRAMPLYERIVEMFSSSEWADDALLRVAIYAAYKRDTAKARRALTSFRDQFSTSELLPVAADVVRMTVGLPMPADRPVVSATKSVVAKDTAVVMLAKGFTLQVGRYDTRPLAAKAAATYTAKRMRTRVVEKLIEKKKRFVIFVGDYATEDAAVKDINAVSAICKCKPIVVRP